MSDFSPILFEDGSSYSAQEVEWVCLDYLEYQLVPIDELSFCYFFVLSIKTFNIFVLVMALSQSLHTAFIELTFVKLRNFNSVGPEHKTPMIDVSTITALWCGICLYTSSWAACF